VWYSEADAKIGSMGKALGAAWWLLWEAQRDSGAEAERAKSLCAGSRQRNAAGWTGLVGYLPTKTGDTGGGTWWPLPWVATRDTKPHDRRAMIGWLEHFGGPAGVDQPAALFSPPGWCAPGQANKLLRRWLI
jgi:hypothetical protein